jgi:hypothetical protein
VLSAEHHDRITGLAAVGARAQSPPHAEGIYDRHPRAAIEQPLDESFRRIGFARSGGADDRDAVIERIGGKSGRQNIINDGSICHAGMARSLADRARRRMLRRPITQAPVPSPSDLAAENARLRRENERLRMERDILKKAALIFGAASR